MPLALASSAAKTVARLVRLAIAWLVAPPFVSAAIAPLPILPPAIRALVIMRAVMARVGMMLYAGPYISVVVEMDRGRHDDRRRGYIRRWLVIRVGAVIAIGSGMRVIIPAGDRGTDGGRRIIYRVRVVGHCHTSGQQGAQTKKSNEVFHVSTGINLYLYIGYRKSLLVGVYYVPLQIARCLPKGGSKPGMPG